MVDHHGAKIMDRIYCAKLECGLGTFIYSFIIFFYNNN